MVKMFHNKDIMDYMTEMNRLFPRTNENDGHQTHTFYSPSPSHMVNRSSSSADSTSPESYPEMSPLNPAYRTRHETPLGVRRPIIGRKIIDTRTREKLDSNTDFRHLWQPETPPEQSHNMYELFPTQSRGYEFQSPGKKEVSHRLTSMSPVPSNMNYMAPNLSNMSPNYSTSNLSNISPITNRNLNSSPRWNMSNWSPSQERSAFQRPTPPRFNYNIATGSSADVFASKMCTFCRKNGETPTVYMTHCVREQVGNKSIVACPILRSHVCSTCGASGDNAHTITYCPILRSTNNGKPLQSTTITLKNTRIKSNGRRRY